MIVYAALTAASILWAALILAAPWLMAEGHFLASAVIYKGFSAVCHQAPERSFYFHGGQMGVCSRCASIYAGFIIGLLLYPFLRDLREERFPPRWILIAAAAPAASPAISGHFRHCGFPILARAAQAAAMENSVVNQWWLICVQAPCDIIAHPIATSAEEGACLEAWRQAR